MSSSLLLLLVISSIDLSLYNVRLYNLFCNSCLFSFGSCSTLSLNVVTILECLNSLLILLTYISSGVACRVQRLEIQLFSEFPHVFRYLSPFLPPLSFHFPLLFFLSSQAKRFPNSAGSPAESCKLLNPGQSSGHTRPTAEIIVPVIYYYKSFTRYIKVMHSCPVDKICTRNSIRKLITRGRLRVNV